MSAFINSGCGACVGGACLMNGREIQACDDCRRSKAPQGYFETDEDAAEAVWRLYADTHLTEAKYRKRVSAGRR